MFGLPAVTTAVLIGIPLFWVLYTVGFLVVSRNWAREDVDEDLVVPAVGSGPAVAQPGGDVR